MNSQIESEEGQKKEVKKCPICRPAAGGGGGGGGVRS